MKEIPLRILICDDDPDIHEALRLNLGSRYKYESARSSSEATQKVKNGAFDLLLLDIMMETDDAGLKAIPILREIDRDLDIIMLSGLCDFETVRNAMRMGATDYLRKDFSPEEIVHAIERVIERRRLLKRQAQQSLEAAVTQRDHQMIGSSLQMQKIRELIRKIRDTKTNVIIVGKSGTGKEVVARQLRHTLSDGTLAPFFAIDSSTIQSTTAESILFGHEKGAFTDANETRMGIFEAANGGTVYFDEISNMPPPTQAKLLRVLEEKVIRRLGSTRDIPLDFRVICATNQNLETLVEKGEFRGDLFQRLNVASIELPALRARQGDIPALIHYFVQSDLNLRKKAIQFTPDAMKRLMQYPWPGNVRELRNVIAYVITMAEGAVIQLKDLPSKIQCIHPQAVEDVSFYDLIAAYEKEVLAKEYEKTGGSVAAIASNLRMNRSHLYNKLKEYGLFH